MQVHVCGSGWSSEAQHHSSDPKKSQRKCPGCDKDDFKREKSKKEHWRVCPGNPNKVGPFPCPVPGCKRGTPDPFTRTRNLNQHLKNAHGHNPKHVK